MLEQRESRPGSKAAIPDRKHESTRIIADAGDICTYSSDSLCRAGGDLSRLRADALDLFGDGYSAGHSAGHAAGYGAGYEQAVADDTEWWHDLGKHIGGLAKQPTYAELARRRGVSS